jgi:hypothetical protein
LITIYLGISWIAMLIAAGESFGIRTFDWVSIGHSGGRVSGPAGNPSFLAGQMMVNGLLALALFTDIARPVYVSRRPHTIGLALFFVLTIVTSVWLLTETGTRGSVAGLLAGGTAATGLFAWYSDRGRMRIAFAIAGAAVPIRSEIIFHRTRHGVCTERCVPEPDCGQDYHTFADRWDSRIADSRSGVCGEAYHGLRGENFEVPFQLFQQEGEIALGTPVLDRAHNKPLDLLATTGLIGFTAYMAWRSGDGLSLLAWASIGESDPRTSAPSGAPDGIAPSWIPAQVQRSFRPAAPILVGVIVTAGVYLVNVQTFRAAQLITETGSSVEEVAANLDYFSPLATFGRERLLNVMSGRWEELDRINLIKDLEDQTDSALAAEGDNMELHFAVARFYRVATTDLPELMERARFHTNQGPILGPQTASTARAPREQADAEAEVLSSPIM